MADSRPLRRLRPAALLAVALPWLAVCSDPSTPTPRAEATGLGPRLRLRISGSLEGRLEPCGCASGQLGGLARRSFYLQQEADHDLLIEGGNLVKDGSALELQKLATALSVLDLRGYAVLGVGPRDLQLPLDDLGMYLSAYNVQALASDLVEQRVEGRDPLPLRAYRDHAGTPSARVASLALAVPEGEARARLRVLPPAEAWAKAMADCPPASLRILLVHGTAGEVRNAAQLEPRPDLVIGVSEAFNEPPSTPETVDGVPVVFTGIRGRMILDVILARRDTDGTPEITRYRVVPLEGSKSAPGAREDKEAKAIILDHRQQVKALGLLEAMANRHAPKNGASFVGNEHCADCHEEAQAVWAKSKHAVAWQTLVDAEAGTRYGWPVTRYPDCVECHVVGYGQTSGFVTPEKTPKLGAVGCEACHGPGSHHIEAQTGKRPAAQGLMGKVEVNTCLHCHDFEQSPGFVYGERWKEIEHR